MEVVEVMSRSGSSGRSNERSGSSSGSDESSCSRSRVGITRVSHGVE